MFWLNRDISTGLWKLHVDSCRFCNPVETRFKGVNEMKKKGAWISFESAEEAKEYFKKNSEQDSIWQPCKTCNPEKK
jgi:tetrahydrodipicolinate N-succinyltransferase